MTKLSINNLKARLDGSGNNRRLLDLVKEIKISDFYVSHAEKFMEARMKAFDNYRGSIYVVSAKEGEKIEFNVYVPKKRHSNADFEIVPVNGEVVSYNSATPVPNENNGFATWGIMGDTDNRSFTIRLESLITQEATFELTIFTNKVIYQAVVADRVEKDNQRRIEIELND
jgi:hypothetical protein